MAKRKKGFTLVELLAVIVILAVILVIAVPQIMNTISESRKGALASSAKLIASSAETAYISNQTLGIEKNIECRDISNYTDEDYASCSIKFADGKAIVKIIGKGKFEGMAVCSGTKDNAEVKSECNPTAVEKIESLAIESNVEGLKLTSDGNIRYTGASPKNYIKFNNEDWRIIGLFEVRTSSEKIEKLMKIVSDTVIAEYSWDSSSSSVNNGYGVNEWSQADLQTMLNTLYLNQESGTCYNGENNVSTTCDFSTTGISSTYRNMIESVVWNTGAIEQSDSITPQTAYEQERGTTTGKTCSSGSWCTDTVNRTTTWTGKVGLIYPSDYGYASTSCTNLYNTSCYSNNWLKTYNEYWTISAYTSQPTNVCLVLRNILSSSAASNIKYVRPSLYLKSDVSITSGDGSSSTPYQISM